MNARRRWVGLVLVLSLLSITWQPARAQSTSYEYFDETGHNLTGAFLDFYRSFPEPELLFGYPLTEQFRDKTGQTVQYFQRAHFELDPSQPPGQRVHLTPLGRSAFAGAVGDQLNAYNPSACRVYPETGFPVCFAFLEFFDRYGGVPVFGYPISTFMYQQGLIVQYFENARFEWRPANPSGQFVSLSDLGSLYFETQHEDPALKMRAGPLDNSIQPQVLVLTARAFPNKALALSSDQQTIFIMVQDQTLQPVPEATILASISWPSGQEDQLASITNEHGLTALPLSFSDQPFGELVVVEVRVSYQGLTTSTSTSFRIWH